MSHVIFDIPNGAAIVSGIPLSMARSAAGHLHPKNVWERNSTSMGPRYIVRYFDNQRGNYLLCNMVTLQSLRLFSLSVDESNPIDRTSTTNAGWTLLFLAATATEPTTQATVVTVLGTHRAVNLLCVLIATTVTNGTKRPTHLKRFFPCFVWLTKVRSIGGDL